MCWEEGLGPSPRPWCPELGPRGFEGTTPSIKHTFHQLSLLGLPLPPGWKGRRAPERDFY